MANRRKRPGRILIISAVVISAVVGVAACHSAGVDVTIQNNGFEPIRNVELDYPHASFGVGVIQTKRSFWYHIKPTDSGKTTISFELENGKTVRKDGPAVRPDMREKLAIILDEDANHEWHVREQSQ